jgi:F-type H+-transporting ATPase subunit b
MPRTEAASNFLVPNATFIAELIAFFIILWFLWKYVIPPVNRLLEERQEVIRKQIEESKEARESLEKAESEYKQALTDAREEATQLREEARSEGKRIKDEITAQAREEAANIASANHRQMEIERQRAMSELRTEIGKLSVELAGRIVGESLEDEARRTRTVDRFIADLEATSGERTGASTGSDAAGG